MSVFLDIVFNVIDEKAFSVCHQNLPIAGSDRKEFS